MSGELCSRPSHNRAGTSRQHLLRTRRERPIPTGWACSPEESTCLRPRAWLSLNTAGNQEGQLSVPTSAPTHAQVHSAISVGKDSLSFQFTQGTLVTQHRHLNHSASTSCSGVCSPGYPADSHCFLLRYHMVRFCGGGKGWEGRTFKLMARYCKCPGPVAEALGIKSNGNYYAGSFSQEELSPEGSRATSVPRGKFIQRSHTVRGH